MSSGAGKRKRGDSSSSPSKKSEYVPSTREELENLRAFDLKAILSFRGLSTNGAKKTLIQRILDDDQGVVNQPIRGRPKKQKPTPPPPSSSSSSSSSSPSSPSPSSSSPPSEDLSWIPSTPMDSTNENCVLFSSSSSSFLKDKKTLPADGEWKEGTKGKGVYYVRHGELPEKPKSIIGFDMDSTLITTKSGRKFPANRQDWVLLFDCVPGVLQKVHEEGALLFIMTNQGGAKKDINKLHAVMGKIDDLMQVLKVPMVAIISTMGNEYRKPAVGTWELLVKKFFQGEKIGNIPKTYVGDAAGRPDNWDKKGAKKDFACSDRKYALNIGINFRTPEHFFLGEHTEAPFDLGLEPKDLLTTKKVSDFNYASDDLEMVLLIGSPAAGKSTFYRRFFQPHGYIHVNRDTTPSASKLLAQAREGLRGKESVVVDNTNPSPQARAPYIQIAEEFGVPVRCFHLTTPREVANHLNTIRATRGEKDKVPDVGFNMFKKNFQPPNKKEGFTEIIQIDFQGVVESEKEKKSFCMYT